MAALAERGFTTVNHARIADWLCGRKDLPDGPTVALGFDDNRLNIFENAAPVMEEHGFTGTVWTISRLADGELPQYQVYPWMNWDHLGQLQDHGWEIGAHTASHFMGPALLRGTHGPDGAARYVDELVRCNDAIEHHLGVRPRHFAYPGGEWNDAAKARCLALCRQYGLTAKDKQGRAVPLDPPADKREDESLQAAKAAIISALPPSMKPPADK